MPMIIKGNNILLSHILLMNIGNRKMLIKPRILERNIENTKLLLNIHHSKTITRIKKQRIHFFNVKKKYQSLDGVKIIKR